MGKGHESVSTGIGKLVFGVRKLSSYAVQLENGKTVYKPCPFIGDCRNCSLLDLVCKELESPCTFLLQRCDRPEKHELCEGCDRLDDCLAEKPCCWECPFLIECLKNLREEWGEQFIKSVFGCDWEELEIAVKMLAGSDEK